jgi:prepilin-type N-terminal cleavage/methylation domain-containing protein
MDTDSAFQKGTICGRKGAVQRVEKEWTPGRPRGESPFVRDLGHLCPGCFNYRVRSAHFRRAFTLLEVLVVVAVIALLIAILIPSLHKAREEARRVACLSQLRQLSLAWHQYLDAHKGAFYQATNADKIYGGRNGMLSSFKKPRPLNRYVHQNLQPKTDVGAEVFHCPCDRGEPDIFTVYGTSYRTNPLLVGKSTISVLSDDPCQQVMTEVSDRIKGVNQSDVSNPTKVILMGDFHWVEQWDRKLSEGTAWHGRRGKFNVVFLDNHVDSVVIRKGIYTDAHYTVIPFADLQSGITACQEEIDP